MTETVAAIVSVLILVIGISYLVQAEQWIRLAQELMNEPHRSLPLALLLLVMGLPVIAIHNLWVSDWRVVVTIFGWLLAIKGFGLLVYPQLAGKYAGLSESFLIRYSRAAGVVFAVIGAWLSYQAWFAA